MAELLGPNNSFKPNLFRYGKSVAIKACHAFSFTAQVGLIQALCSIGGSMRSTVICFFAALVLPGCATTIDSKYKPSAAVPISMVRLVANTNSAGTMGRHYNFALSENNACIAGPLIGLGARLMADDHLILPSAAIPAGKPITLVVQYREARAAQIRACGNVAKFSPEPGHNYDIQFNVTNQGTSCAISVLDAASGPIALDSSDSCYALVGVPNGKAHLTNYEVHVQSYP